MFSGTVNDGDPADEHEGEDTSVTTEDLTANNGSMSEDTYSLTERLGNYYPEDITGLEGELLSSTDDDSHASEVCKHFISTKPVSSGEHI